MQPSTEKTGNRLEAAGNAASPSEPLLLGCVLSLTALVYAATLRFGFVYDDQGQIVRNVAVHSWRFVPDYFRGKQWQVLFPNASANYYRPFNFLWFRVNDALFGLQPAGWHALTILLHVLATFLAYSVARRLTSRPLVAALTALLFGVHPMRHEVVAWVSGATESLWAVFFFLAFLAYLNSRERERARWMAISCVLYAAGLLSKETAIVLPIVVFAHSWIYGSRAAEEASESSWNRLRRATGLAAVYGAVAVAYLGLRISFLHGFQHPQSDISLRTVILTFPSVAFFYLRQWLLPIRIGEFYDLPLWSRFDTIHVLVPAFVLLGFGVALWFARRSLGSREVGFAAAWMVVTLLPVLDFVGLPPGQLVHDRYFYLPGFGAALLSALALAKLAAGAPAFGVPRRLLIATLALLVFLSYATANAASYWMDEYTFSQRAYQLAPDNVVARINYAVELARRGDYFTALPILERLVGEQPNNWLANYNLGRLFYDLGILPAAEGRFEQTLKVYPTMPDSYMQLGLIDGKTNRLEQAEANLRRAVEIQPYDPMFRFSLGVILQIRLKCDAARAQFVEALALDATFSRAREQMSKCGSGAAQESSSAPATAATPSPAVSLAPTAQSGPVNSR